MMFGTHNGETHAKLWALNSIWLAHELVKMCFLDPYPLGVQNPAVPPWMRKQSPGMCGLPG